MIVEIVGGAGVGKTTIANLLRQQIDDLDYITDWRHLRYLPALLGSAVTLLPHLLSTSWSSAHLRYYTRKELNWMARLVTSRRILQRQRAQGALHQVVLLDQGPIYTLARLAEQAYGYGEQSVHATRWRSEMVEHWSTLLDLVIWLDAPSSVLVDRVFSRSKAHWLQLGTVAEATAVLQLHQQLYAQLLAQLERLGRCRVIRYNSSEQPATALAAQIGTELMQSAAYMGSGIVDSPLHKVSARQEHS